MEEKEEEKRIYCTIEGCNTSLKNNKSLRSHERFMHSNRFIWRQCDIEGCTKQFKENSILRQHKMRNHGINIRLVTCDIEGCTKQFKTNSELKIHKQQLHLINVVWYNCDIEGCTKRFKDKNKLYRHKKSVHLINVVWYNCDIEGCTKRFKSVGEVNQHKMRLHPINIVWYKCDIEGCNKQCKRISEINLHKQYTHSINVKWYYCDIENCTARFKANGNLSQHKTNIHGIMVIWYPCDIEGCKSKFKRKSALKTHKSGVHDIGEHECPICIKNRNSVIPWKDQHGNDLNICRDCFSKSTGKDSRKECRMSDYLDEMKEIRPFLVGTDDSFKSMGGCSLKRPDKLYISDIVLWIECDEFQHTRSASYECDDKRISDSFDEFGGRNIVVIRWNPDHYTPFDGSKKFTFRQRLIALKNTILEIMATPITEMTDAIYIYYMFYDTDNSLLSQNYSHTILH